MPRPLSRRYDLMLVMLAVALFFVWPGLWRNILSVSQFMPHGMCYLWIPQLVSLHLISDLLIGFSYVTISTTLAFLVHKAQRDIPFHWVFLAFGLFIVACGATHFMEVWTIWQPVFWLSGYVKLITALASVATAVVLPPLVPKILDHIHTAKVSEQRRTELESANNELTLLREREHQGVERALRESEIRLAGIVDSAMDGIITVDEEQRIVLFNAAAEEMFICPAEDAIGRPLDSLIPERFRSAHAKHIQDFGRTHVSKRTMGSLGAIFGLRADGEEFSIEASISQLQSEGQKFYTVILRDITERRKHEEATKEQARMLDLAPVLIRDLNDRIIFWNSGTEQMYGWKAEEALGQKTHALLQTKFPAPRDEIRAKLFSRGYWKGELVMIRRAGERIEVASHWVLHRDQNNQPKAILEVNNDITELKQAEREIRRLNEELEQRVNDRTAQLQTVNKELEAFAYSVSHDLRAPLRHINGFSLALLEDHADQLDEAGKGYLREVRGASQEMSQLIDDVLQLARVARSEMRHEVVFLSELAKLVIAELQNRDPGRTIQVNIEDGLQAHGDRRLLQIVLTNLLGNAWKFTSRREQPEITLGSQLLDGELIYFVRDNGAGFNMAYVDKLFRTFQRLHAASEFEGTGIGLATVQRIVNRHGGRVWAEGVIDQGATFYFTLTVPREPKGGPDSEQAS